MKTFKENDVVELLSPIKAQIMEDLREVVIPKGYKGTIVLVYDASALPLAYEIEFFIEEQDCYALATVDSLLITAIQ